MARNAKKSRRRPKSSLERAVVEHPVRTAAITAGAVVGAALLGKAANTAARIVTIKAVARGAKDVARAASSRRKKRPAKKSSA